VITSIKTHSRAAGGECRGGGDQPIGFEPLESDGELDELVSGVSQNTIAMTKDPGRS
jgi:hypothetical protein